MTGGGQGAALEPIDYGAVAQTAASIVEAGRQPTIDGIRCALGRGTTDSIAPLLRRWASEHQDEGAALDIQPVSPSMIGLARRLTALLRKRTAGERGEAPGDEDEAAVLLSRILDGQEQLTRDIESVQAEVLGRDAAAIKVAADARELRRDNTRLAAERDAWRGQYVRLEAAVAALLEQETLDPHRRARLLRAMGPVPVPTVPRPAVDEAP